MGPPWGVPFRVGASRPPIITPAVRKPRTGFSTRLSSTARFIRIEDFILCCGLVPAVPRLSCLPSTLRCGAYLHVDPRFCLRPPSGAHCCTTLSFGYRCRSLRSFSPLARISVLLQPASVRLVLDFSRFLSQGTRHRHLAARPCPAHNHALAAVRKNPRPLKSTLSHK